MPVTSHPTQKHAFGVSHVGGQLATHPARSRSIPVASAAVNVYRSRIVTEPSNPLAPLTPREKVKTFPDSPGVYLMKDAQSRVIYVGKAVNLRNRAGSYFNAQAAVDRRTADLVTEIADLDYIQTHTEVDALLLEARLIKDIQPKYNQELKDDKTFPYLQITTNEDFPRVEFTRKPSPTDHTERQPAAPYSGSRYRTANPVQTNSRTPDGLLHLRRVPAREKYARIQSCRRHSFRECVDAAAKTVRGSGVQHPRMLQIENCEWAVSPAGTVLGITADSAGSSGQFL